MNAQDVERIVSEKTDEELREILATPRDWRPNVVAAAKAHAKRRGIVVLGPQKAADNPASTWPSWLRSRISEYEFSRLSAYHPETSPLISSFRPGDEIWFYSRLVDQTCLGSKVIENGFALVRAGAVVSSVERRTIHVERSFDALDALL